MDLKHQDKYDEYDSWFNVIEGMCNQKNNIGVASLIEGNTNNRTFGRYTHYIIDGIDKEGRKLHVFIKGNNGCQIIKISDIDLSTNSESRYMSRHISEEYCSIKLSTDDSFGNIRYFPKWQNKGSIYSGTCHLPRNIYATSNVYEHIVSQIDMTEKLRQQIEIVQRGSIREIYEDAIELHDKIKETVEKKMKQLEEQRTQEDDSTQPQVENNSEELETKELTAEELQEENIQLRQKLEEAREELRKAMKENDGLKAQLVQARKEKNIGE